MKLPGGGVDWRAPRNRPFAAFLRAARRGRRALWRTLLGALALFGAVLFAATLGVSLLGALQPTNLDAAFVFLSLASLAAAIPALALILPALHRRGFWSLFGPSARRFWRGVAAGFLAVLAALLLFGAEMIFLGVEELTLKQPVADWRLLALAAVPLIFLQASAEELAFRGYLLQQLAARCRSPLIWALAPSLLFGALHYAPEGPSADARAEALAIAGSAAAFGLLAAYLTWRTGSLGAAVGLHVANNLVAILLIDQTGGDALGALALFALPTPPIAELLFSEALFFLLIVALFELPYSPVRALLAPPPWRASIKR